MDLWGKQDGIWDRFEGFLEMDDSNQPGHHSTSYPIDSMKLFNSPTVTGSLPAEQLQLAYLLAYLYIYTQQYALQLNG